MNTETINNYYNKTRNFEKLKRLKRKITSYHVYVCRSDFFQLTD